MARELKPCGTIAGAVRHYRRGETVCDECRAAEHEYQRAYREQRREKKRRGEPTAATLKPCGTTAAYRRHLRAGEEPCRDCRAAMGGYQQAWRAKNAQRKPKREVQPCGTVAAYHRHWKAGEPPCEDCRRAIREYAVARRTESPRQLQPCGTPAGYARHKSRGEEVCEPCRTARNAAQVERRARKRQQVLEQARAETVARQAA